MGQRHWRNSSLSWTLLEPSFHVQTRTSLLHGDWLSEADIRGRAPSPRPAFLAVPPSLQGNRCLYMQEPWIFPEVPQVLASSSPHPPPTPLLIGSLKYSWFPWRWQLRLSREIKFPGQCKALTFPPMPHTPYNKNSKKVTLPGIEFEFELLNQPLPEAP